MSISRKNSEQYSDPTAYEALTAVERSERIGIRKRRKFMPLVYICSRYAADEKRTVSENEEAAIKYSRFAIEQGCIPLASHLLYPRILDDSNPEQRKLGLFFGQVWLDIAREIWIFSDGSLSKGMQAEYDRAKKRGYRIRYFNESMEEVGYGEQRT